MLWKHGIQDLPEVFRTVAAHGCRGVEFCHRPDQLLIDARTLRKMLSDYGLTLVGLSGGTLRERMEYCDDELRPEYLYVEDWEGAESQRAMNAGFVLALHPHLFKPVHRLAEAEKLLREHRQLRFLPDTAHLTIAGDSPAHAVSLWRERLAAVHLKDWTPIYGRSSHRYARGFVELGTGIVNFEMLFERLLLINYSGWLVIEQGKPESSPEQVIAHATKWLGISNFPHYRRNIDDGERLIHAPKTETSKRNKPYSPEKERQFLDDIFHTATEEIHDSYPQLTQALGRLLNPKLILLCACNPPANIMGILGAYPRTVKLKKYFMGYSGSLSSVAVERQAVTVFKLNTDSPAAKYNRPDAQFGYPSLAKQMNLSTLISVPILNPQNPHQARFIVNIFLQNEDEIQYIPEDLLHLGNLIAQAADAALDERCALASATASFLAGDCQQADAFLDELLNLILEALYCRTATIFLVNDIGDCLEPIKTTGLIWNAPPEQRFYQATENPERDFVSKVWQRREAIILSGSYARSGAGQKSMEAKSEKSLSGLCAPMVDVKGAVIGVIRCQNKQRGAEASHMFSEDDLAVLDAICQTAVPHLQVLLSKERRAKALRRLTHELNYPLVALTGATENIRTELQKRHGTSEAFFSEDFVGDIESWIGLMQGLLGNADFFRLVDRKLVPELRRTFIYGDVLMPVIKQIKKLLDDRDFSPKQIFITQFKEVPPLWLDKKLPTQVAFNLLSNAIKYADEDPKRFRVKIVDRETDRFYEIDFSDWGPGIPSEMKDAIFLEGVRSKHAEQSNVSGDGLGLWVVKRAVQAHGGEVELTSFSKPTTFTVFLPKVLVMRSESILTHKGGTHENITYR